MTSLTIRDYLASLMTGTQIMNGFSSKAPSISVFQAPESRSGKTSFVGGAECNDFKKYPVNILVRWSDNTNLAQIKANEIYSLLDGVENIHFEGEDIAYIMLLDDAPIWIGRDESNIVEFTIRADIFYYN